MLLLSLQRRSILSVLKVCQLDVKLYSVKNIAMDLIYLYNNVDIL